MSLDSEQWHTTIRDAYAEFRASDDPNKHLAADRLLRQYPFLEPNLPLPPPPPPGVEAYRESGHYVMAYLIRKGFTDRDVPIDRSLILPVYRGVTLRQPQTDWAELTAGLGSMSTVAQVLLGGFAAERRCYQLANLLPPEYSPLVGRAKGFLIAYLEEYGYEDERKCVAAATNWLTDMRAYTDNYVATTWQPVEALAQALLHGKDIARRKADALVAAQLSDDAKHQAQARLAKARARWGAVAHHILMSTDEG